MAGQSEEHTNRLIKETSPYLLQHAHNPVDWFAWSNEAFEKAKTENKPVFLSVGYSACHWCHVMEKESFSNQHIAQILNENFVSIKVDREERPDLDEVYMNAVVAMTGSGGWPLSVFLTPDGEPFYGGTYFPPTDFPDHPAFSRVLSAVVYEWKNHHSKLIDSAGKIRQSLMNEEQPQPQSLSVKILDDADFQFKKIFDRTHGGFGSAPKFPQPVILSMLLGYWHRTKDKKSLSIVELTLKTMAKGGIYDHLGGGFHRYSVDSQWLVPHFEKMLYDQALVSKAYIQAYQATGKEVYAKIAKEIFDYVMRDMTDKSGGFYSAEDADSEGKEGAFYVWKKQEIQNVLEPQTAAIFNEYYSVTEKGNFEDGKNTLHIANSIENLAKKFQQEPENIESILAQARLKLLEHRTKRPRPTKDDKIISGWNGLMIASLSFGGAVLGEQKYIDAAKKCADFLLNALMPKGRLMRYYRNGKTVNLAVLDDYAFLIMGLIDLYQADFEAKWLVEAKKLTLQMMELFNNKNGGFYLTGKDTEQLIVRQKPGYDGPVPGGNSAAAYVLLKLGRLTMEQRFTEKAKLLLDAYSGQMAQMPRQMAFMLTVLDFYIGPSQEIVVAGHPGRQSTQEMLKIIRNTFLPNAVILCHQTQGSDIEKVTPYLRKQTTVNGKTTVYICQDYTCSEPKTNISALKTQLRKMG